MDLDQIQLELKQGKAILLDVREQDEWDKGHLVQARHLPLSQLNKGEIPQDLPKDKTIYLHCQKGGRAELAANILKKTYKNVTPLKFSFEELKTRWAG